MGKYRSCIKEMTRAAKKGKMRGNYSVFPDEISLLEAEGFTVTLPSNYYDTKLAKKLAWEVGISWKEPAFVGGTAYELNKLVNQYRNKCNAVNRTCQTKENTQAKMAERNRWIDNITCF